MVPLIGVLVGIGAALDERKPHDAIMNVIAILVVVYQSDTITGFCKISPLVGTDFKLCRIPRRIFMCGTLHTAVLNLIGGLIRQNIHREGRFQENMVLMPISSQRKINATLIRIDGNRLPKDFPCANACFIKGDGRSYSIAAASILAKVYRDRLMCDLAKQYPYYGFEKNAGYGTKAHIEGVRLHGVTPQHRRSYRPIKEFLATGK